MPIDCSTSYHMQLLQPIKCGRTPPSVRVDHHLMVRVGTGSLQFVLLESPSPKTNVAMENAHVYAGMKLWDGPCSSQVFYFYFFLRGCSLSVGNRHDNFGCFNVITFICCLSYMLCRFFFLEKEQLECRMFLNASNEKHETWGSTVGVLGFFVLEPKTWNPQLVTVSLELLPNRQVFQVFLFDNKKKISSIPRTWSQIPRFQTQRRNLNIP